MRNRKLILWTASIIGCTALICVLFAFFLDLPQTTTINWSMHGALVSANGEVRETMEITATGTFRDYSDSSDQRDTLLLEVTLPDSFRYMYNTSESEMVNIYEALDVPYFICPCIAYERIANDNVSNSYAISLEEELIIMYWKNADYYLIASREPNADPEEILDYFHQFTEFFPLDY